MLSIRAAAPADIPVILYFIRSLALYEREPDAVKTTEADLLRDGFGAHPRFECLIAEEGRESGDQAAWGAQEQSRPVGFALFFYNYSTWRGRAGIHLEDLFVMPEFRGRGIGKRLLSRVAARAVEQGLDRLRWDVLEWNQTAIDFYRSIGAQFLSEWRIMRVTGEALESLGSSAADGVNCGASAGKARAKQAGVPGTRSLCAGVEEGGSIGTAKPSNLERRS